MQNWKRRAILFLLSQGISLFGSSIVQFAIACYVILKTSSGIWVSSLTICAYVPQFLISFFAGVWADRYPKKMLIILADSLIAVATLVLALLMPNVGEGNTLLFALVIISVIRSIGTGVQTPAVNSVIPQIVPQEHLMRFNGINSAIQSLVQFAAPAVAGAVLSFRTLRETLFIDIATAVLGVSIISFVSIPFIKQEIHPSLFGEMKCGFKYAITKKFIGKLLLVYGIFVLLCVPAGFLATLFVSRYYGDTYWNLTLTEVVGFIGMTVGGIIIGAWGGFKNRITTLTVGIISFGILAAGMGFARNFIVYLILMAVYGVALTMVQTASTTLLQENTQGEMQGRIFGLFGAMYSGFLPLGMAVFGPLADIVSMRSLMLLSGVMLIILAVILIFSKSFRPNKV